MTWRRFFDALEPVHALVAEEGDGLIGFVHYLSIWMKFWPGASNEA